MGDFELGLKAPGTCLGPLLEYGVPGNNTVAAMLHDIDSHLAENHTRISECVKELMEMSQTLSGQPQKFVHPTAALGHITDHRLLDRDMCNDPDADSVARLLNTVLQTLEKNPGCEEKVLVQLFEVCGAEGLSLPYRGAVGGPGASTVSINAATDSGDQRVDQLWADVCLRMKRFYSAELRALGVGEARPRVHWAAGRALTCVQALRSLLPAPTVWDIYTNVRAQQLDACVAKHVPAASRGRKLSAPLAGVSGDYSALARAVCSMMDDDFTMLNSGVFSAVTSPVAAISDIYLERLTEHVHGVINNVLDELGKSPAAAKSPKPKEKRHGKSRDIPKSPSDVGFLGKKISTPKLQSKSADNLLSPDRDDCQFSDIQVLPSGFLPRLTDLVSCLLQLESHLDSLQAAVVWESMAGSGIKPRPKAGLKSALKSPPTSAHSPPSGSAQSPPSSHKLEETKKSAFSPRSFEHSGLPPEAIPAPYGTAQAMIAQLSASLKVVEKPSDDHVHWPWRSAFSRLTSDLSRSVQSHVTAVTGTVTAELAAVTSRWETVAVETRLVGGRLDYPARVAQGVLRLMSELDSLLPLAAAGPDIPFDIVRAAFIDATVTGLKNVSVRVSEMVSSPSAPHRHLYTALASLAYIRNHLLYYETRLGGDDNSRRVFPSLYRQYCDAVDRLTRQLIERHTALLTTSVLHDAHSHHWDDSKEFYEGERCSFSVQMWHLHMQRLRRALWAACPPKLGQSVFTAVLLESVNTLSQRYLGARPTYRRNAQIRVDIVAILLTVSELLFPACGSLTQYLDPTASSPEHLQIHTACCLLLAAMGVLTAPLDALYRVYKKGFKKKRSLSEDDITKGYVTHWLSWIRPQVFPLGKTTPDDLQTTSALYLQLRLLTSKPDVNWTLLLQCLLMKDYTLPIMLLTHLAIQHSKKRRESSHKSPHLSETPAKGSHKAAHSARHKDSDSAKTSTEEVFRVCATFLLQCGEFQNAFSKVMLPVFERSNSWDVFDMEENLDSEDKIPPWLSAIFHCLDSFLVRVLDPGIRVILTRHNEPVGTEPIALRLRQLPCHCPTSNDTNRRLGNQVLSSTTDVVTSVLENHPNYTGSGEVLSEALYSVLTQLSADAGTLPAAIITFFWAAQRQAAHRGVRTPHDSLGVKIIAVALRRRLRDCAGIESLVGAPLEPSVRESMGMLGECVYHVLTATSFSKSRGVPKAAGMFVKANRNWVSDQIGVLTDLFSSHLFELSDAHPLDDTTAEFSDHLLTSQASIILGLSNGESGLRLLHRLLVTNESWIVSQLDIPPLLATQAERPAPRPLNLDLGATQADLSPLTEYNRLGDGAYDQAALVAFPLDYTALLAADLGLAEAGLRTLLCHRHDMQEGAYLDDHERKHVDSLRRRFHTDSPEL